jgi:(4-(4-[2-(gamma-L-glutamylamino)ethyl]phenoxymethyl)furan-2-yl)methanamine synthase
MMCRTLGWDIGAVNVKAALLSPEQAERNQVASQPLEIWRDKNQLPGILQKIYADLSPGAPPQAMAVTMTAELSDAFSTKREGVLFVLECLKSCFPDPAIYCLSLSGEFVPVSEALSRPLEFAAANWLASALWIAKQLPNCLLLDVGSTTTDIIPILDGDVNVSERTDLARLSSGELVYTGALRTNLAAIVQSVPVAGQVCRVASEYFAISGDVHLILGNLEPHDYTCPTPDGQAPSVDSARKRLARLVCADDEMLSTSEIDELARHIYTRQIRQIQEGIGQVISRLPQLRIHPVVILGSGAFLGKAAAVNMGLKIEDLSHKWGKKLSVVPCLASALLLAEYLREPPRQSSIVNRQLP